MGRSRNSKDKEKYQMSEKELKEFNKLFEGHRELLIAIGKL